MILDFTEKKIKNYVMIDVMGDGMSPAEKNCARPRARTSYIVHKYIHMRALTRQPSIAIA